MAQSATVGNLYNENSIASAESLVRTSIAESQKFEGAVDVDVWVINPKTKIEAIVAILACMHAGKTFLVAQERLDLGEITLLLSGKSWRIIDNTEVPVFHSYDGSGNQPPLATITFKTFNSLSLTSGTMGESQLLKVSADNFYASAQAHAAIGKNKEISSWLISLPLSFMGGLASLIRGFYLGYNLFVLENSSIDRYHFVLNKGLIDGASLVPSILAGILRSYGRLAISPKIKNILLGGDAPTFSLMKELQSINLDSITFTYGLTETVGQIAYADKLGAEGIIFSFVKNIRWKLNSDGELFLSGDQVVQKNFAEELLADSNGWLPTGDLFRVCDSGVQFQGRKKSIVITGGKNIVPSAVEEKIGTYSNLKNCIVVGLPHDYWGEEVVGVCLAEENLTVIRTPEVVVESLRSNLHGPQRPKRIIFCSHFPMTSSGKVDRKRLVESLMQDQNNNIQSTIVI